MRKLALFALWLSSGLSAWAQYTHVVATPVEDQNGCVYQNCTYSAAFINQNTTPGSGPPLLNGSVFQTAIVGAKCDGNGNLSTTLADNDIVSPLPSQWRFSICDQTGVYCFQAQMTITGSSQNIGATLTADSVTLPACPSNFKSFSAGNLPPVFTTTVTDPDGPNITLNFLLTAAAGNTIFGNWGNSSGVPSYNVVLSGGSCGDSSHAVGWTAGTGFTCQAISGFASSVTGIAPIHSTGGATPAISLQNSTPVNVTAAYGTDTAYPTASGGPFTTGHIIIGDAQGGVTQSTSIVSSLRSCEIVWGGSASMFALQSGDDAIADQSCLNEIGATETITGVYCRSDVASNTTTVDPHYGTTGSTTEICSAALTCGSSGAYSSSCTVSNSALAAGDNINPVMGGTLTGTSIHVLITYTVPVL